MDAQALYDELSRMAWKFVANSVLDVDDIRQELYLLCQEVAEGRSAYMPELGGVEQYIMGRLWGLVQRWPNSLSLDDMLDESEPAGRENSFVPEVLHAPSVEEVLERRDALYAQDVADIEEAGRLRERMKGQSSLFILVQTGHWSMRDAARFCGVSHKTIQNKVSKAGLRGDA